MTRRRAHCAWGGGCAKAAGHGRFGSFCAKHAAILAEIRERLEPERRIVTVERDPERDARDLERAQRMTDMVRVAGAPVTGLHHRLGLSPQSGEWRRAVALAKARGWIATKQGAGYVPGPAMPAAEPERAAAAEAERDVLKRAKAMAEIVREADVPVTALHRRFGLTPNAREYRRAVELAKANRWIQIQSGIGFVPGEAVPPDALGRVPVSVRAARLARYVQEAGGRTVTKREAADALDMSPTGSFARVARYAIDHGMIERRLGPRGGYLPPAADTESLAA